MRTLKISMLGAGSFFVVTIAKELLKNAVFDNCKFSLMDVSPDRLDAARKAVSELFTPEKNRINLETSTDLATALDGADYVISSCEKKRYAYWAQDFRIAEANGVHQIKGENGGPNGLIHGLRQICLYKDILEAMQEHCPKAWLMNFSNPMSTICTYAKNYFPDIKTLGFCHQVHGSIGLIAEQLGMRPGELEVISAGVNHLNWLFDIRKKGTGESCMEEFIDRISNSKYWHQVFKNVPKQALSLDLYKTFKMYPIGYDDHVCEYMPFLHDQEQWASYGLQSHAKEVEAMCNSNTHTLEMLKAQESTSEQPPFPLDPNDPYYAESPCGVINALETNTPLYLDAINIRNNGAVDNLPPDVILDVPAVIIGGQARSIHVGALPPLPCEVCRRQAVLHEMIAQGAAEGNGDLIVQALCLDPYVCSFQKAKSLWADYRKAYATELTTFK
ncbi:MAG: hypothetical protein J5746_03585 [Victivallales bacterium]|nr:hypothetical protein [Victivallales bacterium]